MLFLFDRVSGEDVYKRQTHERFSARDMADKLVLASHENPVKKKRHIWVPVSYTHLDVYKRQVSDGVQGKAGR